MILSAQVFGWAYSTILFIIIIIVAFLHLSEDVNYLHIMYRVIFPCPFLTTVFPVQYFTWSKAGRWMGILIYKGIVDKRSTVVFLFISFRIL